MSDYKIKCPLFKNSSNQEHIQFYETLGGRLIYHQLLLTVVPSSSCLLPFLPLFYKTTGTAVERHPNVPSVVGRISQKGRSPCCLAISYLCKFGLLTYQSQLLHLWIFKVGQKWSLKFHVPISHSMNWLCPLCDLQAPHKFSVFLSPNPAHISACVQRILAPISIALTK